MKTGGTTTRTTARRGAGTAISRLGDRGTVRPVGPLVALLPAHDEEGQIAATIESLLAQSRPPDGIVVVCDNCTDRTAEIAARPGVERLRDRRQHPQEGRRPQPGPRRAAADAAHRRRRPGDGRGLARWTPTSSPTALARLPSSGLGAVGGTFTGRPGGGLVGMFQRNEYARYARDVASAARQGAGPDRHRDGLPGLGAARGARGPQRRPAARAAPGQVYDTRVLTEDNELTLALLHLGTGSSRRAGAGSPPR